MQATRWKLDVQGMSCGHCVGRVRKALEALPGVRVESVEVGSAAIAIESGSPDDVVAALADAGYPATLREG